MSRIAIAQIFQETNTFAVAPTTLTAFTDHALYQGAPAVETALGTDSEVAGAHEAVLRAGHEPVPLLRAWAMPSGRLTADTFAELRRLLCDALGRALPVDGVFLSLHGALSADGLDDADGELVSCVRRLIGPDTPFVVSVDLHANVTAQMVRDADALVGYHEYPHIDMADTGRRAVRILTELLRGRTVSTSLAKVAMIVPPEGANTREGALLALRTEADAAVGGPILDVSLFPVQPWLDIDDLGFAVTVTADTAQEGDQLARRLADRAWAARREMSVELVSPADAIARVRAAGGPALLVESADSPTAGGSGDSPAMVHALLAHGRGLRAYVAVVDPAAVGACWNAGVGARVACSVGAGIDRRFHRPCPVEGEVALLSDRTVRLTGVLRGMDYDMGRHAVIETADGLAVLVAERPPMTFDPDTFRAVGLPPEQADIVVVRSAFNYRDSYRGLIDRHIVLDLPGASTPRLAGLPFSRVPRPMYPLDAEVR